MAATGKVGITLFLVRLYTSLRFWGGLLLLFFLTFFIMSLAFSDSGSSLFSSLYFAAFIFAMMPMGLGYLIRAPIWDVGYAFPIIVWILQLGAIAWLRFKSVKLERRTIIIIGSIVLLLLVTQFVGCTIVSINLMLHPPF